ncbi:hypothetical protein [Dyella sp.]|uniref:hypothetical protein n=1 Tax=Dyella sp. TaxID=1869338 RepID=UPI003F7FE5B4
MRQIVVVRGCGLQGGKELGLAAKPWRHSAVMPAKAGIHVVSCIAPEWTPASAGMTAVEGIRQSVVMRGCGLQGGEELGVAAKPWCHSAVMPAEGIHVASSAAPGWIPASTGMTAPRA